jgi:hypothetical protein
MYSPLRHAPGRASESYMQSVRVRGCIRMGKLKSEVKFEGEKLKLIRMKERK